MGESNRQIVSFHFVSFLPSCVWYDEEGRARPLASGLGRSCVRRSFSVRGWVRGAEVGREEEAEVGEGLAKLEREGGKLKAT